MSSEVGACTSVDVNFRLASDFIFMLDKYYYTFESLCFGVIRAMRGTLFYRIFSVSTLE